MRAYKQKIEFRKVLMYATLMSTAPIIIDSRVAFLHSSPKLIFLLVCSHKSSTTLKIEVHINLLFCQVFPQRALKLKTMAERGAPTQSSLLFSKKNQLVGNSFQR